MSLLILLFLPLACDQSESEGTRWAMRMADAIMKQKPRVYGEWDYVTGTVLKGFVELWKASGKKKYFDYIRSTVDAVVHEDGTIEKYQLTDYNIDQINQGRILLFLYQHTAAAKYKKAAEQLRQQLREHPRTSEGGFWHKRRYPYQMWLDGIYMGCPFYAEYGALMGEPENFNDVVRQILLIEQHTRDEQTGLLYHGWDERREQSWADKITGRSPCVWGRAVGWYAMALVDVLDVLPPQQAGRDSVVHVLQRLAMAIAAFQDQTTGLWWQVMDRGDAPGNYLEASASCMFVYTLAKAARCGYLEPTYRSIAEKGYRGILQNFISENPDGTINLEQICETAGLGYGRDGSYEYYVHQTKRVRNDGKGLGPFILASLEF